MSLDAMIDSTMLDMRPVLGFYCRRCGFEYAVRGKFWREQYSKGAEHTTPCLRCDNEMYFCPVHKTLMMVE